MCATRIGIALFALAVAAGPLYTAAGYSPVANLISELAAQNTPRNFVMSAAFVALGAGIVVDGLRAGAREQLPFIAFGGCMALAGLFGHRPIAPQATYVEWVHSAHSVLATAAGVSITLALLWQAFRQTSSTRRLVAGLLACACIGLPLAMLALPPVQGLIQRLMYLLIFAWLWVYFAPARPGAL